MLCWSGSPSGSGWVLLGVGASWSKRISAVPLAGEGKQESAREKKTHPSSKCLQRFSGSCFFVLQFEHSCFPIPFSDSSPRLRQTAYLTSRSTIFLVVFAFLWKTGLV